MTNEKTDVQALSEALYEKARELELRLILRRVRQGTSTQHDAYRLAVELGLAPIASHPSDTIRRSSAKDGEVGKTD